VGPAGNAGFIFRVTQPDIGADAYCGYYAGLNPQSSQLEFGYARNGWHPLTNIAVPLAANAFYRLKVLALGPRIRVYVSNTNQPVLDLQDSTFPGGMIGVRDYCPDGDRSISSFSNLVVRPVSAPTVSSTHLDHGRVEMTVAGVAGPDYSIWATPDLQAPAWSLLFKTNPASVPFLFTDAAPANNSRRFYRVMLGP
jgi:hypothetical protein